MNKQEEILLSQHELEILQEIMNIAFGKSASDLAEIIDTHVVLSVPFINIMQASELPEYIKEHIKDYTRISIVEQKFWGKFKGDALLVFSSGSGKELIKMMQNDGKAEYESDPVDILEGETLMEAGNILIGACVGKISELLKDSVSYAPPVVIVEKPYREAFSEAIYVVDNTAIVLKTDFRFDKGNVSGFLFIVTNNNSLKWLKESLHIFIGQY